MSGTDIAHLATASPQVLNSAFLGTTADTTIYTAAAATSVVIKKASVTNTTGSAATFTIGLCKTGQTAGAANRIMPALSLAAGDVASLDAYLAGHMLGPGDFITGYSGTASAIGFVFSGIVHA